jgi:hypothetical protein
MRGSILAAISGGAATPIRPVAPRIYRGNMCGIRVAGVEPVQGGSADPSLVLSWFYDRYSADSRAKIRAAWKARGDVDVLVSWPDSRGYGYSAAGFVQTCQELVAAGFLPCVFLSSKDYDPPDVSQILANIKPVLGPLIAAGVIPRASIGWELSIWLQPIQVQDLIDNLAPPLVAGGSKVYVHFQEGYFAFQEPGKTTADFWAQQIGKLTGILHQRDLTWDKPMYQARIVDCLQRFAGGFNFPVDSGFGHPFDFIALEITAQPQFEQQMGEVEGDSWGTTALDTPASSGPLGPVPVMGSGNGQSA